MPAEPRPYKMPLWPLPPLVVVGFTAIALATQETQYLIAEIVLIAAAIACWLGAKKWAPHQDFPMTEPTAHDLDPMSEHP
jgi:hypothetical protein